MKTTLFKYLFLLLVFSHTTATAQGKLFLEEVNGRPIRIGQYEQINGSPYLYNQWQKGTVKLASGQEVEELLLKYDVVAGTLLFKGDKGEPLEFIQPVIEFNLPALENQNTGERIFRNGFKGDEKYAETAYFEVLTDGRVKLLKKLSKFIREEKAYNSATITKNIVESELYYLYKDGSFQKIKTTEKAILAALQDKSAELKKIIEQEDLRLNRQKDLIRLVEYYNTL